jgi:hypothetical protein
MTLNEKRKRKMCMEKNMTRMCAGEIQRMIERGLNI